MKNTREKILSEAFKLFLKRGYNGVSMNDLVKSSGLSKGAFYHYFSGKEELFREAVTAYFFTPMSDMKYQPDESASLRENLLGLVKFKAEVFKKMLRHTGIKTIDSGYFTLIFEGAARSAVFRESLSLARSDEHQLLKRIFKQAKQRGETETSLRATDLAHIYSSMLDGMELHAVVEGTLDKLYDMETEATVNFCKMISRPG